MKSFARIARLGIAMGLLLMPWACGKPQDPEPPEPEDIPVSSVTIGQPTAELFIGETAQLTATVLPADATDKKVTWTSSKQSVASVSETGLVTALEEGVSTITASAGGKSASCLVTVSRRTVPVSGIILSHPELYLTVGEEFPLTATVKPEDATDKTVTWSSSNPSVASVQNGVVSALKAGTAVITAKAGDKTATCSVTVSEKVISVESVVLNQTELTLVEGESATLTATVNPANATDKTVTWSSSDPSFASVQNGVVTAHKAGTAVITAKAGNKTATCSITVKEKDPVGGNEDIGYDDWN